jgi:hypothetical protein
MKNLFIINITLILMFGCKDEPTIRFIMLDKVRVYDKFYSNYKDDMLIELNRLTRRQKLKEYSVRRISEHNSPWAAFQTTPNIYTFKNFECNPIDSAFVLAFKEIDCLSLKQKGSDVYIESKIKDSIYILFKGDLLKSKQFIKSAKLHKLDKNWIYFSYYFDPEVDRRINWQRHGYKLEITMHWTDRLPIGRPSPVLGR